MSQLQKMKDELKQEYKDKLEAYIKVAELMEKLDKEFYDLAIKKAAGCNTMIKGLANF